MAAAFVNLVSFTAGDPSATTLVFPSANHTAGNLLVVIGRWASTATATVTDTAGNTYLQAGRRMDVADSLELWYCLNCLGSATNVITVTLSAGAAFRRGHVLQYSGFGTGGYEPSLFRSAYTASTASTTVIQTPPPILSTAVDQIIVAGFNVWNLLTWTAQGGWTNRTSGVSILGVHDFIASAAPGELRTPSGTCTGSSADGKQAMAVVFTGGVTTAVERADPFIWMPA